MTNFAPHTTTNMDKGFLVLGVIIRMNKVHLLFVGTEKEENVPLKFGGLKKAPAAKGIDEVGNLFAFWTEKKCLVGVGFFKKFI